MIPEKLRNLFKPDAAVFEETALVDRDLCAIFSIAGTRERFALRREYLHGFTAGTETSSEAIGFARAALGAAVRSAFVHQLLHNDTAQILHAESLQNDIVRLTFHTPEKLNRKANGYVLLTGEIAQILKDTREKMFSNGTDGGMDMLLATDHNTRLLTALVRGYIPGKQHSFDEKSDGPIMAEYVAKHFEIALPKLQKS